METTDLDARIDALYHGPLDGFVDARQALAKALRAEGHRETAEQVKALAKPSVTAWAVNQVWWHDRGVFERLLDAGRRLLAVQQASLRGEPAQLRAAVEARHEAVNAAVERAVEAMGGPDRVAPAMRQRIAGTLDALATGGIPGGIVLGRLASDLQPAGFSAFAAVMPSFAGPTRASGPASAPSAPRATRGARQAGKAAQAREPVVAPRPAAEHRANVHDLAEERERAEARARARAALDSARRALDEATALARERREAADAARRAFEAAQARVVAVERELDQARREETASRSAVRDATRALTAAEDARERAERELAKAEKGSEVLSRRASP
jgi:hypothetical protein